jgi:A/G-specific adenine glycosylase
LWSLPECALDDDVLTAVHARFGARVELRDVLPSIAHGFTHFALTMHPQRVSAARWPTRAEAPGMLWLTPADAHHAALPAPIKQLLRSLAGQAEPDASPSADA